MTTSLRRLLHRQLKDERGGRVVAVIECVLNQNARDAGAASCAAMNAGVVAILQRHGVGMLQMPCPEIRCLGWRRDRPGGASIQEALDTTKGRQCCQALSVEIAERLQQYTENGIEVLAVLGGNERSPGCAVHMADGKKAGNGGTARPGVFMSALHAELARRGLSIPFRGLRDADAGKLAEDLAWLEGLLRQMRRCGRSPRPGGAP